MMYVLLISGVLLLIGLFLFYCYTHNYEEGRKAAKLLITLHGKEKAEQLIIKSIEERDIPVIGLASGLLKGLEEHKND